MKEKNDFDLTQTQQRRRYCTRTNDMFRIISPGSQGTSLEANNDSKHKMLFSSVAADLILHQQIAVLVHYLALMPKFEIIVKSMIF